MPEEFKPDCLEASKGQKEKGACRGVKQRKICFN